MAHSRSARIAGVIVLVLAVLAFLGTQAVTHAQPTRGTPSKPAGNARETNAGFEDMLATSGVKNSVLTVHIRATGGSMTPDSRSGKFVQATDSFLVIKLANQQQDLVFIPWKSVLLITAHSRAQVTADDGAEQ